MVNGLGCCDCGVMAPDVEKPGVVAAGIAVAVGVRIGVRLAGTLGGAVGMEPVSTDGVVGACAVSTRRIAPSYRFL